MILHFHSADTLPGESSYLNIDTDHENYNFNIDTNDYVHYIEVSRLDLDRIYKECDFNCYWHSDNLLEDHDSPDPVPFS